MNKNLMKVFLVSLVMSISGSIYAQEANGFKKIDVKENFTENGTPYYTEATMVIECKTMYAAPFDPQNFKSDVPKRQYSNFPAGLHTMYIGEVVNAWTKN